MEGRMELKHRLILTTTIAVGGAIWAAVLGFGAIVVVAVTIGAALPVWLMSRTSLLEPNRRPKPPSTILDELEAQRGHHSLDPGGIGETYVLTRARPISLFGRRVDEHRHAHH